MKSSAVDRDTEVFCSASSAPSNFGVTVYNEIFRRRGLNYVYLARRVTDAAALVASIRALDVRGCSVSMPMKRTVLAHLDEVDAEAAAVSSVNTVFNDAGRLVGHNTDIHGFRSALPASALERVVVYGSGSVTASILHVLKGRGVKHVFVTARSPVKTADLRARWAVEAYAGQECDLFVNATPASLSPLTADLVAALDRCAQAMDLVVPQKGNHLEARCRERGVPFISGFAMYKHQLVKQFAIYTGITVDADEVDAIARERGLV